MLEIVEDIEDVVDKVLLGLVEELKLWVLAKVVDKVVEEMVEELGIAVLGVTDIVDDDVLEEFVLVLVEELIYVVLVISEDV